MKSIKLEKVTEKIGNQEVELTTLSLIKTAVNNTPQGGFSASEMLERLRILDAMDKLEEGAEELSLEDSDYKRLGEYVKATKWAVISRFIMEFSTQFN